MRTFLRCSLIATALTTGLPSQAQITIDQNNFPALPTSVELYQGTVPGSVTSPARGANQTWDYSALLPSAATGQAIYMSPPANPAFPTATRALAYVRSLGGLPVNGVKYEALTATGLRDLGFSLPRQAFSLTFTTGGPSDSLVLPSQNSINPATYQLPFPLTMGSTNAAQYQAITQGIMTVAFFGLNQAPMRLVQRIEQADTVVGWGTIRVPTSGGPSAPQAVLMVRHYQLETDSVYLRNVPAPTLLLTAFGLQQGQQFQSNWIDFYRAGSSQPLASFFYTDQSLTTLNSASYSREADLVPTGAPADLATRFGGLAAYPNPATNGRFVIVAGNGTQQQVLLTVRDLAGRTLLTTNAVTGQATDVLAGLTGGTYLLNVKAADGVSATLRVVRQ